MPSPITTALIVAAGSGLRVGGALPKQYQRVGGKALLRYSVETLLAHKRVNEVRVVISAEHRTLYEEAVAGLVLGEPIIGGPERQDSVRLGLEALATDAPTYVMIHDAARPMLPAALIDRICDALLTHDAVMPTLPIADTLRERTAGGWAERPRDAMMAIQTPQAFRYTLIREAHRTALPPQRTDDIAVLLAYDANTLVHAVDGAPENRKITTSGDMAQMAAIVMQAAAPRVAMGFDVHRLIPQDGGTTLRIGGIDIAHDAQLEGHSDADVVLHAITDALLGTIADGDIGAHFSPSDARWKGADSESFLTHASDRVKAQGGTLAHLDVTILCEAPKIGPHRDAMRARIASMLGLALHQVSVKATTTEGLGFTGRREGIAAQAVVTVMFARSEAA